MSNLFIAESTRALRALKTAQRQHARLKAKADQRLQAARARHLEELEAAAAIEAHAWRNLLAVPGVSAATAAALCDTSEAAVHRWIARNRPRSGAGSRIGRDEAVAVESAVADDAAPEGEHDHG